MNTSTQLKALIRNLSKEKQVDPGILLRNYMLERLLERISISDYKENFILKGGMLVAAIVGLDTRSTMDMDATIKGQEMSKKAMTEMFKSILLVCVDDGVLMDLKNVEEIHDDAEYAGLRISIETIFDRTRQMLKVDVTTGEKVTPKEIKYKFKLMLENRHIEVMAYNIETVLAEKIETIITRSTSNTRMRDFYDIYIITKLQYNNIEFELYKEALVATSKRRGTLSQIQDAGVEIEHIATNSIMIDLWKRYQRKFTYAEGIKWDEVIEAVRRFI